MRILVCSANIGNTEPTPESIAAWLPNNGDIGIAAESQFPLSIPDIPEIVKKHQKQRADLLKKYGDANTDEVIRLREKCDTFDIIAIGMQEATFHSARKHCTQVASFRSTRHFTTDDEDSDLSDTEAKNRCKQKKKSQVRRMIQTQTVRFKDLRNIIATEDHQKEIRRRKDTNILYKLIFDRCPSYTAKVTCLRGEMRLIILIRNDIQHEVSQIEVNFQNTGIGSVLANKGGIVATLTIRETRLAFISAHLAAHEGPKFFNDRRQSLKSILTGAKVGKFRDLDVTLSSHHCFLFGDLNFRVCLPSTLSEIERLGELIRLVDNKMWNKLMDYDELNQALRSGNLLVSFRTLPCNFPPTFKVERGYGFVYKSERTPSYTDRILWRSTSGLEGMVKPFLYEPCPNYTTSDHKPIRGAFELETNSVPHNRGGSSMRYIGRSITNLCTGFNNVKIVISNLQCKNLEGMDLINRSCNPFILFAVQPKGLLRREGHFLKRQFTSSSLKRGNGWPMTKHKKGDLNPNWSGKHFELNLMQTEDSRLDGALLYFIVFNHDITSQDNMIGAVAISLRKSLGLQKSTSSRSSACAKFFPPKFDPRQRKCRVDELVLRKGQDRGTLKCDIQTFM